MFFKSGHSMFTERFGSSSSSPIPIPRNDSESRAKKQENQKDKRKKKEDAQKVSCSPSLDKNKFSCIILHEPSESILLKQRSHSESRSNILQGYNMPYSTFETNSPLESDLIDDQSTRIQRRETNQIIGGSSYQKEKIDENMNLHSGENIDRQPIAWKAEASKLIRCNPPPCLSLSSEIGEPFKKNPSFLSQSYNKTTNLSDLSNLLLQSSSPSPPRINFRNRSTSYDASKANSYYENLLDKSMHPNSIPNLISDPIKRKQLISEAFERSKKEKAERDRLELVEQLYHNYYLKKEQKKREFYENYQKLYKEKTYSLYGNHTPNAQSDLASSSRRGIMMSKSHALIPYGCSSIDNPSLTGKKRGEHSLALTLYDPSIAASYKVKSRAIVLHRKALLQEKSNQNQTYEKKTIYDIPDENIELIIDLLDAPSLCALSQVDRYFQKATNNDRYWYSLCLHEYGVDSHKLDPPPNPVKDLYRVHYLNFLSMKKSLLMNGVPVNGANLQTNGLSVRLSSHYAALIR